MSVGMEAFPLLARSRMSPSPMRLWEAALLTLASMISNSSLVSLGVSRGAISLQSRPWLGIETDLYTQKPDVKQQTIVGGTSSGSVFAANMPTTSLRLTVWTMNLIIRSPSMSDVFQPYGGIGYGLFFATGSQGGQSNTQANPGFQFVAGARYVLTQEWALFGEFKYNNTSIRFSGIQGNYDSQNFVVGLMWHFGR